MHLTWIAVFIRPLSICPGCGDKEEEQSPEQENEKKTDLGFAKLGHKWNSFVFI
jgi:hypothetical protein